MNKHEDMTIEEETIIDCPILYRMKYRSMSESPMCFGWEHDHGWDEITANMSRELEVLNMQYYPTYRVRIQLDQIKEKFGGYVVYYSIITDPNRFITWLIEKLDFVYDFISNCKRFNYGFKKVIDIQPYDYDDTTEISKEKYETCINDKYKPTNVEYFEKDRKYFEIVHLKNYGKFHYEPTQHKLMWYIKEFCNTLRNKLQYSFLETETSEVRNVKAMMNIRTQEIIRKAEDNCNKTCEICGTRICTSWSPTCQTTGYIRYICDRCAEKHDGTYLKNGELWQKDKMLKTAEEVRKQNEEYEKKLEERYKA